MPVLVTRPVDAMGLAIVSSVAATGGQVRAFVAPSGPVGDLRTLGAICAVGDLLDEGHVESAMEQVHTVVHLTGLPLAEDADVVVEEAATVVTAAVGAGVRRLIVLSLPGAEGGADDALRRAAAEVEEMVSEAPFPVVVLRPSLIDTPELRDAVARTPLDADTLANVVAPVTIADIAAVVLCLDDQRDVHVTGVRVLGVEGSTTTTVGEYLDAVGVTPMSLVGRVLDRLRPGTSLLAEALAGPWLNDAEVDSAWAATGLRPTGTDDVA